MTPNNAKYSTALYMRLSRDDENFGDSVSIETQQIARIKYIENREYFNRIENAFRHSAAR